MDYIFTRLKQELFVHSIISIHYYEYTSEFRYPGEAHDFWELILCDSGELLINAGDKEMILSKGQAYLHPPMQYHNVHAEGGRSANSVILSFESDTPELWNVCDKIINTDSYITTALFSILREAKVSFSNQLGTLYDPKLIRKADAVPFGAEQIIQNYAELLLIYLVRDARSPEEFPALPTASKKNVLLQRILAYMKENLSSKITFTDITETFSVSPTTLKNLFRSNLGHGVMEHLTHMRLEYAKELLRDGNYSCTDIAATCGFCSIHHFSSTFRRLNGMSPTEYVSSIKSMLE